LQKRILSLFSVNYKTSEHFFLGQQTYCDVVIGFFVGGMGGELLHFSRRRVKPPIFLAFND